MLCPPPTCPRRTHAHVGCCTLVPRQMPWCLGFPADNRGQGLGPPLVFQPHLGAGRLNLLPRASLHIPAPPPRPPMASPDTSHKRHSVVLPGPLNSARLCVLGKGCTGGGVRWAPVAPRTAQGLAGGWGLGEQGEAAWGTRPPQPMAACPPGSGCPMGHTDASWAMAGWAAWQAEAVPAGTPDTGTRVVSGAWGHKERSGELGRPPCVSTEPGGPWESQPPLPVATI